MGIIAVRRLNYGMCIACGVSISGFLSGWSVPHLDTIAIISAIAVGAISLFILPTMGD